MNYGLGYVLQMNGLYSGQYELFVRNKLIEMKNRSLRKYKSIRIVIFLSTMESCTFP